VHPAGKADGLARIGEAQRAAGMAAIGVHRAFPAQGQKARRRTHGSAALVKKRPPGAQVAESVAAPLRCDQNWRMLGSAFRSSVSLFWAGGGKNNPRETRHENDT
jgi:hypothetical protein